MGRLGVFIPYGYLYCLRGLPNSLQGWSRFNEVGEFFRRVEMIETDEGYLPYSGACCHCGNPMCVSHVCIGLPHRSDA